MTRLPAQGRDLTWFRPWMVFIGPAAMLIASLLIAAPFPGPWRWVEHAALLLLAVAMMGFCVMLVRRANARAGTSSRPRQR